MRPIKGGNYSWPRVGHQVVYPAIRPGPDLFRLAEEFTATELDRDLLGLTVGRVYRRWVWDGYPIAIDEDTTFFGSNFSQQTPHTEGIFSVAPGVRLVFDEDCNLLNVTLPDGAEVHGGNGQHGIDAPTGDAARPTIKLLCECARCCTYRRVLQDTAALPRDEKGRILHHLLKDAARARRENSTDLSADRTWQADSNLAAMARFGRTVTTALRTQLGRGT
ncbi:MAG TPA: hypothetical protein VFS92_06380 [Planctomycetota bacterium]|nr:hypothetical protein [Planctomycetota bacterium]